MPQARPDVDGFLPLTAVSFEILLSLAEGELHGYAIMLAIEERTGGRLSLNPGTLYRALDRMVGQGLLERVEGEEAGAMTAGSRRPDRGGAERHKFFKLSPLGTRVAAAEAERLADQVNAARSHALLGKPTRPW